MNLMLGARVEKDRRQAPGSVNYGKRKLDYAVEIGFLSWFVNKMTPIVGMMNFISERQPDTVTRARDFLWDLEHHYQRTHIQKSLRNAFRFLRFTFNAYPNIKIKHAKRAIEMIKRIYSAFGLSLEHNFEPRLALREKLRRKVKESVRKYDEIDVSHGGENDGRSK